MRNQHICVAGLTEQLQHVRPVLPHGRWTWDSLCDAVGPFEIGAVVPFDNWRAVGRPPETEDHEVSSRMPVVEQRLSPSKFVELMEQVARPSVPDIFGPELERTPSGRGRAPKGVGGASLGVLARREVELVSQ